MQMLTVAFRYGVSEQQFAKDNGTEAANIIAQVPGLVWKYWLHNSETKECLGVYHFTDKAAAQAYVDKYIMKDFQNWPGYTVTGVKHYGLIEENSTITRAPGVKRAASPVE